MNSNYFYFKEEVNYFFKQNLLKSVWDPLRLAFLFRNGQIDEFKHMLFHILFYLASFKGCISRVHMSVFFWSNVKEAFEFNEIKRTFFEENCYTKLMLKYVDLEFILNKLEYYLHENFKTIFDGIAGLFLSKKIVIPIESLCNVFSSSNRSVQFDVKQADKMLIETRAEYVYKIQKFIEDKLISFKNNKIMKLLSSELKQTIECMKHSFEKLNPIQLVEFIEKYAPNWEESDYVVLVWSGYCTYYDLNQAINIFKRKIRENPLNKKSLFCTIQTLNEVFSQRNFFYYLIDELKRYLNENKVLKLDEMEKLNCYIDDKKVICLIEDLLTPDEIIELTIECSNPADLISKEALNSLIKNDYLIKLRISDLNKFHQNTISCNQAYCSAPSKLINYNHLIKLFKNKLAIKIHEIVDKFIELNDYVYTNDLVSDLIESREIIFPRIVRMFRKNILNDEKLNNLKQLNLIKKTWCLEMNLFKEKIMKNNTNINYINKVLDDYIESSWLEYGHLDYLELNKYVNKSKHEFLNTKDLLRNSEISLFDEELIQDFIYLLKDALKLSISEFSFTRQPNAIEIRNLFELDNNSCLLSRNNLNMSEIEKKVKCVNVVTKKEVIQEILERNKLKNDLLRIHYIISSFKKQNKIDRLTPSILFTLLKENNLENLKEKDLNFLTDLNIIDRKLKDDYMVFLQDYRTNHDENWVKLRTSLESYILKHALLPHSSYMAHYAERDLRHPINETEWNTLIVKEGVLELQRLEDFFKTHNCVCVDNLMENIKDFIVHKKKDLCKYKKIQINIHRDENKIKGVLVNKLFDILLNWCSIKKKKNIDKKSLGFFKNLLKKNIKSSKNNKEKNILGNVLASLNSGKDIISKIQELINNKFGLNINYLKNETEVKETFLNRGDIRDYILDYFLNEEFKRIPIERFDFVSTNSVRVAIIYKEIYFDHQMSPKIIHSKAAEMIYIKYPRVKDNNYHENGDIEVEENVHRKQDKSDFKTNPNIDSNEALEMNIKQENLIKDIGDLIENKNEIIINDNIDLLDPLNTSDQVVPQNINENNLSLKSSKEKKSLSRKKSSRKFDDILNNVKSTSGLSLNLKLEYNEPSAPELDDLKNLFQSYSSINILPNENQPVMIEDKKNINPNKRSKEKKDLRLEHMQKLRKDVQKLKKDVHRNTHKTIVEEQKLKIPSSFKDKKKEVLKDKEFKNRVITSTASISVCSIKFKIGIFNL